MKRQPNPPRGNFLTRLFQRKATPPKIGTLLFPSWLNETARWLMENRENFIAEGYNLNAVIFAAIMYKARAASSVPLVAHIGTREQPEPLPVASPLARFCDRPNPWLSFSEMQMVNAVFYNLFGNSYTVILKTADAITAYPLRPDFVTHLYKKGDLVGYAYHPGGYHTERDAIRILAQDMLHVKIPNPGDPYAGLGPGLSPLYPLARSADVDNAATEFLKIFFQRGAMPQYLLTTEQQLDNDTAEMLKERFVKAYGNFQNWTDPVVLGAGATISKLGTTIQELDMTTLDRRNESRMAMAFGVPLTLIESAPQIVQSTYSNKETDRRMFWEDTMIPELRGFEVEWTYYLRDDTGAFVSYDYSEIPALAEFRLQRAESYRAGFMAGAVTQNEYRAALDLAPLPNGDAVLLPASAFLTPITATPTPQTEQGAASAEDEGQLKRAIDAIVKYTYDNKAIKYAYDVIAAISEKGLPRDQKMALWRKQDATSQEFEPNLAAAGREAFETDRRNILALVREAQIKAYERKATVGWQATFDEVENYLNGESQTQWRSTFEPVFEQLILTQQGALSAEFGRDFTVRNLRGEAWFQDYTMKFADEIAATSLDEIKAIFEQALREGWTVGQMEEQLGILFNQWVDGGGDAAQFALDRLPPQRLELIARDQSVRASNAGSYELYKDWGVTQKEWLATPDDRTRDAHRVGIAWGKDPLVSDIGGKFHIGNSYVEYPGDPAGQPEDVIQCRCTLIPVIPD